MAHQLRTSVEAQKAADGAARAQQSARRTNLASSAHSFSRWHLHNASCSCEDAHLDSVTEAFL